MFLVTNMLANRKAASKALGLKGAGGGVGGGDVCDGCGGVR